MAKAKKGFTLLELSIVIAVTAIVVVMVCGFIIAYNQASNKIVKSSDAMADISLLRNEVNKWIDENDDGTCVFTISEDGKTIMITGKTNSLSFNFENDCGELVINEETPIKIATISSCKFSKKENIDNVIYGDLIVQIGNRTGDSVQYVQLVFDVNYGLSRERS